MDPSDIQFQQTTGLGKFLQYTKLIAIANITIHNWKLYKKKKTKIRVQVAIIDATSTSIRLGIATKYPKLKIA